MRGIGADVIFGDEMAHMDPEVFFLIIVPLLEMSLIMLIGISSPGGENNFYTILVNLENDDGTKMFLTYKHEMICDTCKGRENQIDCRHLVDENPPWKSIKGLDVTRRVLQGREQDILQESLYVSVDSGFM